MTPEELEAIPGIDEAVVSQIQSSIVSFYGQYDAEQSEVAPVEAEEIEAVIDANPGPSEIPAAFDNIETGVLEHDIATHDPAPLDETDEGEVLDLGNVEGLSGAPSSMREMVGSGEPHESDLSDRMEKPE